MNVCWTICEQVRCPNHYIGAWNRNMCVLAKNKVLQEETRKEIDDNDIKGHQHNIERFDKAMRNVPDGCPYATEMAVSQEKS